jgi:hypothetical protein
MLPAAVDHGCALPFVRLPTPVGVQVQGAHPMSRAPEKRILRHMNTTTTTATTNRNSHDRSKRGGGRKWDRGHRWAGTRQQAALLGTIGRPFA